jgi:hypothetical protein
MPRMPAAKERDMNNETEQRERVMAWAHEKIKQHTEWGNT